MYFCLEIHQVSTKYRSKYDIFPILFYCTQHNHNNYKFYSNFTKLDLAKSVTVKVQNTVKTFHEFELQNQQTPVVKSVVKLDLAKSAKVKVQNTVKTFHEFELQNQQTPVVKSGLAYHCQNNRRTLSDSSQLTTSFSTQ